MSDGSPSDTVKRLSTLMTGRPSDRAGQRTVGCDRCGSEVYRTHAVWRCPQCGFKTDCCGG